MRPVTCKPLQPYPDGPWDADGNLRLPAWIERAGPMPQTWPVLCFWATVGRETLEGEDWKP